MKAWCLPIDLSCASCSLLRTDLDGFDLGRVGALQVDELVLEVLDSCYHSGIWQCSKTCLFCAALSSSLRKGIKKISLRWESNP